MNTYVKKRIKNFYEMVYGKGTLDNKTETEYQNVLNNIKGLIKANTPILKEKQRQVLELYYDNEFASIKDIARMVGTYNRIASIRVKQGIYRISTIFKRFFRLL